MSDPSDSACTETGQQAGTTQEQPAQPGRDEKGRFARGNKGGPGNPFNRRVAALRQLLLERVSDDDLAAIVDRLVRLAREGDLGAARLVLAYAVGRPAPVVEPDRLDLEEMQLYQAENLTPAQSTAPLEGVSASVACTLIRASLPHMTAGRNQVIGAGLRAGHLPAPEQPPAEPASAGATSEAGSPGQQKAAKRKAATKGERKPRPAQPAAELELLSVEEIRALGRGLPTAATMLLHERAGWAEPPGQAEQPADSKPEETDRRCANPEQ
jgi:hypothetical protein